MAVASHLATKLSFFDGAPSSSRQVATCVMGEQTTVIARHIYGASIVPDVIIFHLANQRLSGVLLQHVQRKRTNE